MEGSSPPGRVSQGICSKRHSLPSTDPRSDRYFSLSGRLSGWEFVS